ncbi:MAG: hypothetical protein MHM6MM_001745, partial [Cercozoa sp. M6MM]
RKGCEQTSSQHLTRDDNRSHRRGHLQPAFGLCTGRTKTSSSHVITALNKQRSDGDFDSETGVHVSFSMQPSAWMDRDT